MPLLPIHPFPARMAPELARHSLEAAPKGGRVLDPMCGSGTVARAAVEAGFRCIGVDIDPLAVLIARAWITPLDTCCIWTNAEHVVRTAQSLSAGDTEPAPDSETERFIFFWFAPRQRAELARLAAALRRQEEPAKSILTVALSRIIVSKEMMASLARDTSHSRPHKVATSNSFDVYAGFLRSARHVASRLKPNLIEGRADIRRTDARTLEGVDDESIDLALTSPPYLNAIDYLRGHRLALVWMGYRLGPLRETRSASVGAERSMPKEDTPISVSPFVTERDGATLAPRHWGWIRRYASDMDAVLRQLGRVVKHNGRIVLVLGNSFLRGARIDNAALIETLATRTGFRLQGRSTREIPARRRYLPPPGSGQSALDARMRTETVLTFGT